MTRTLSIAIKENNYQNLKQRVGLGKISSFVNQAVEKELKGLEKEKQKEKEQLKKRLIVAYKRMSKNKKLQKELATLEQVSIKDVARKLVENGIKQEIKNKTIPLISFSISFG